MHVRNLRDSPIHFPDVGAHRIRTRFLQRGWSGEAGRENSVRLEPCVDLRQGNQTADHQARASEQDERHGHFEDHQRTLSAVARATGPASAFLESALQFALGSPECGQQTKENARSKREEQSEDQHRHTEMNLRDARQSGGRQLERGARGPACHKQTERASGQSEHGALRKQLANDAHASCAEGHTDGKLLRTRIRAGQQQIRHVDAGDEQDKAHGGEQG